MNVEILMSTYNGEKYIRTQINSILEQDYRDINILIRDDGSTDGTCEILKEYAQMYSNISWYSGKNIGVQKSFFELIQKADLEKDYYAFADQDDKWLPGKISRAVSILERYSEEAPVLYCSDKTIVDEELKELKVTVSRVMKKPSFGNALVQDMCTGCTAVMNKSLLKIIRYKIPDYVIMHDWWFYLTATCFGQVFYDTESYILYRQHGSNVSGAMVNKKYLLQYRLKQFFQPRGEIYQQASEFLKIYGTGQTMRAEKADELLVMSTDNMKLAKELLRSHKNLFYRIKLIFNPHLFRQKVTDNLILNFIILIGKL